MLYYRPQPDQRSFQSERRKHKRLQLGLSLFYRVEGPESVRALVGDREHEATTLDVSVGGIAFLTKQPLPVWTRLAMKIILYKYNETGLVSFNDPIEVIGVVRSSVFSEPNRYRLGACFTRINKDEECEISRFVAISPSR